MGQHLSIYLFDSQQQTMVAWTELTMVVQGGGGQDGQNCPWKPHDKHVECAAE